MILCSLQVQLVMEELGAVEREIDRLEKKVEELKVNLYKEREQNKEWEIQQRLRNLWQQNLFLNGLRGDSLQVLLLISKLPCLLLVIHVPILLHLLLFVFTFQCLIMQCRC